MSQMIPGRSVKAIIPQADIERLDRIRKKLGLTESEAVRNFVGVGIDLYEDLEAIGVPQTAGVLKTFREWAQGRFRRSIQPSLI